MSKRGEVVAWRFFQETPVSCGYWVLSNTETRIEKQQPLVRQSDYLALREELEGSRKSSEYWKAEHLAGNDRIRALEAELAALKARIAESAVAYWHKGRVKSSPLSIGMNGKAEVGQRVRLLLEEPFHD